MTNEKEPGPGLARFPYNQHVPSCHSTNAFANLLLCFQNGFYAQPRLVGSGASMTS